MSDLGDLQSRIGLLVERERWNEAERLLAQAFALAPDDRNNDFLAARIAIGNEDFATAKNHVSKVLNDSPDDAEGRYILYQVQIGEDQLEEAEETILGLLRDYPARAGYYIQYADLMLSTLHVRRARTLAREALSLQPDAQYAMIIDVLADIVEGKRGDARERLAELIRRNPQNQDVVITLVIALHSEHRYREALEILRGVVRANPANAGILNGFVNIAVRAHWTGIPCLPVFRYGMAGMMMVFLFWSTALVVTDIVAPGFANGVFVLFMAHLACIVMQPNFMQRWFRARGVR